MKTTIVLASFCALLMAGCSPGKIYPEGDQFTIHAITLEGTTQNNCAVVVEDKPDRDGLEDTAWSTEFLLDDSDLPEDDGTQVSHTLWVKATQTADGAVHHKKVVITLHE